MRVGSNATYYFQTDFRLRDSSGICSAQVLCAAAVTMERVSDSDRAVNKATCVRSCMALSPQMYVLCSWFRQRELFLLQLLP